MDPSLPFPEALQGLYSYVLAAGLAAARVTGVMIITPAFSRLGLTGAVRQMVAIALALPLVPLLQQTLVDMGGFSFSGVSMLLLKEAAVGLAIGAVFGIPFWAAEAAGDVLDLQRGANAGTLIDPSMSESSITGTLITLALLALFFVSGGLQMMIGAVYNSYALWPPGRFLPHFDENAGRLLLGMLDDIVGLALMLSAPIVILLFLTDLALAFMSRAAQQLHVFDLSLAAKNLVFSIALLLYCYYMLEYGGRLVATLWNTTPALEGLLP